MLKLEATPNRSRTVLTVCLGYVLALYLIIAGLASATQTARSLDALASFDPQALCLAGVARERSREDGSQTVGSHHHDLCCTLACGVALLAPAAFATIVYAAIATPVVPSTSDFDARPSTAPPGLGQGPRAPPVLA